MHGWIQHDRVGGGGGCSGADCRVGSVMCARPLQIVLVNFKKVAPKTAPKLLKSCQKIGKVAVKFEKLLLVARIFHGCS